MYVITWKLIQIYAKDDNIASQQRLDNISICHNEGVGSSNYMSQHLRFLDYNVYLMGLSQGPTMTSSFQSIPLLNPFKLALQLIIKGMPITNTNNLY